MYSASITYYVQIIMKTAHLNEQLQQNYAINQRMHTIKTLYSSNTMKYQHIYLQKNHYNIKWYINTFRAERPERRV